MVHLDRVNNSSLPGQWHFLSLGRANIAVAFFLDIFEAVSHEAMEIFYVKPGLVVVLSGAVS